MRALIHIQGVSVIFESTMATQNLQKASNRSENSRRASPRLNDTCKKMGMLESSYLQLARAPETFELFWRRCLDGGERSCPNMACADASAFLKDRYELLLETR